jgi:hypothetical protein
VQGYDGLSGAIEPLAPGRVRSAGSYYFSEGESRLYLEYTIATPFAGRRTLPCHLWGGCCAETHIAAKIADALANGGSIEGENIQVGMAHASDAEPCRNCTDNFFALARQYGKVQVGFFSYTVEEGSGYDIWTFPP